MKKQTLPSEIWKNHACYTWFIHAVRLLFISRQFMIYSMSARLYFQGESPDWVLGIFFSHKCGQICEQVLNGCAKSISERFKTWHGPEKSALNWKLTQTLKLALLWTTRSRLPPQVPSNPNYSVILWHSLHIMIKL